MMEELKINLRTLLNATKSQPPLSSEKPLREPQEDAATAVEDKNDDNVRMSQLAKDFIEKNKIQDNSLPNINHQLTVDDELQYRIRSESKRMVWYRMSADLVDQDDLMTFYGILEKHATLPPQHEGHLDDQKFIIYADYVKAREECDARIRSLLTAKLFMRLVTDDPFGRIPILQIFNYVMKKTWLKQTRLGLLHYDFSGKGYITEDGMDAYLKELIPTLGQLSNMDPTFEQFYICTAARKFFFFLDPLRRGKIKIVDILSSGLVDDILDLREKERRETNWFCLESALRVYGHYLTLDRDHNGMLCKKEFMNYSGGSVILTESFVSRLFVKCITYEGEMDYRTYVDFVLAMENKKEPQSIQYFFRVLDMNQKGYLDAFDLHYFFKDIEKLLSKHSPDVPKFSDVKDEIFDMIKPVDPLKITLKDLIQSGMGETVISILIDANGFWSYDNREAMGIPDVRESTSTEV